MPVEKGNPSRSGKTRDISTRGVYFTIDQDLGAGAELDITLTLPSEVTQGIRSLYSRNGQSSPS